MTAQQDVETRLAELLEIIKDEEQRQVGYPTNQNFDYSPLIPFLNHSLNNVGDPFHRTNYRANTHEFEQEVIFHFAQLMGLDPEDAWGYVTSGGTEGNMYGLYLARELHPEGMLYFSEEAHYSILKIARILNMPHTTVKRQPDGEIDYDDLRDMLTVHRDRPAIILATIGTTMRGAVDDIPTIRQIIDELGIGEHYIHADAALSGMILPYVDDPQPFGFDAGINSISISGHKLIGAPLPCGVVVTRKHLVETLGRAVEYAGIHDTTLSGSRNGLTPLMLWYAINHHGEDGWRETVAVCWTLPSTPCNGSTNTASARGDTGTLPPSCSTAPRRKSSTGGRSPPRATWPTSSPCPTWTSQPSTSWWLTASVPVPNHRKNTICRQRKPACQLRSNRRTPAHATTMQRIVVMAENRIGVIAQIAGTLAEGGVNLNSIATENEGQHGVVIITTDRTDHALAILNEAGFKAVSDEAVLVQLPDQPGALANLAGAIKDAGLNIRTFHIIERREDYATAAITTDDQERAKTALANRYTVI